MPCPMKSQRLGIKKKEEKEKSVQFYCKDPLIYFKNGNNKLSLLNNVASYFHSFA